MWRNSLPAAWPEWALLLLYWAARLHRLAAFPVFDDEAIHIRQAKLVWQLLPFSGADDGRVLNILLYAPFWPFGPGALWVSRAAYLLVGALGFAALLALGRSLFDRQAGRWAGCLFILLPYAFFFERIALADTLGLPLVALLALGSVRAAASRDRWAALVGGLALAGAILAKVNNLMFVFAPLLAWLLFSPPAERRTALRRAGALYGIALLALAPFVLFLVFRAHSTLGLANILARTEAMPLAERLARQGATLAEYVGVYLPVSFALLAAAGLLLGPRRRARGYAFSLAAVPLLLFALGANSLESRYLAPVAPALVLLAGAGVPVLLNRLPNWPPAWKSGLVAAAIALAGPLGFMTAGWYAPDLLGLPASDRRDYIEGWPSGFGVQAAGQLILERAAREPVTVIAAEGWHIAGLTVHYGWEENLHGVYTFDEDRLRVLWLAAGCDPFALAGDDGRPLLFVTERFRYAALNECLAAAASLIAAFPKPGEANVIEVYELQPPAR